MAKEARPTGARFPVEERWAGVIREDWHAPRPGYPHEGTDLIVPSGTFLYAMCDGEVIHNGPAAGLGFETNGGNALAYRASSDALGGLIKEGDYFLYLHLIRAPKWRVGDTFRAGEGIATSGNTGVSDKPHLHLGWFRNFVDERNRGAVNPIPLLRELAKRGLFPDRDPTPAPEPNPPPPTPTELFTVDQLARISGNPDPILYDLAGDAAALVPEMRKAKITTVPRMAAFLANVCQETDHLNTLEEYGGANPEAYFRSFLGDEWRYHGRGYLMNTWREAYGRLSKVLGVDLVGNPDLLARDKNLAARAACWYWAEHGVNAYADAGNFEAVCSVINRGEVYPTGPINGWAERQAFHARALEVLKLGGGVPGGGGMGEEETGLLTIRKGTNSYEAIRYCENLLGKMRYEVWQDGPVPDGPMAYAANRPMPPWQQLVGKTSFCAAIPNIWLRLAGKRVPTRGNPLYDGGVGAYFDSPTVNAQTGTRGYFAGYEEPFDLQKAKRWARETRCGVLVGRPYVGPTLAGQGHVAILLPSGYVLQSFQYGPNGQPGLNWAYTIEESHAGGYYTRMCHPAQWLEYDGDSFAESAGLPGLAEGNAAPPNTSAPKPAKPPKPKPAKPPNPPPREEKEVQGTELRGIGESLTKAWSVITRHGTKIDAHEGRLDELERQAREAGGVDMKISAGTIPTQSTLPHKRPGDQPEGASPTASPTKKISAVGVGGSGAVIAGYVANQYFGVQMPLEVGMAVSVLVGWLAGYQRKES